MPDLPKKLSEVTSNKPKKAKTLNQTFKQDTAKIDESPQKVSGKTNIITSISSQKRPGRYNIFIDESYAFAVDEQVLIDFMLTKGMAVNPELQEKIQKADNAQKAYQAALHYLSYQLRSEKEIYDYLIDKEYQDHADRVIDKLREMKLLDDQAYAESFVRTKAAVNYHGPVEIRRNLYRKGVAESLIDQALLSEYSEEMRLENAQRLADKQVKKNKNRSNRESQQRIRQFLLQKGFANDTITEVFEELDFEKDDDDEREALIKQGEKAWRRYSKFDLFNCKQKTYANLYQKGFPSDMISQFISEKESEWNE